MKKLNNKILITGGAGYIGQNLVNYLIRKKYQVSVVDNLSTSGPIEKNIKKKIKFYKIDLVDKNKVKNFFSKKNFDIIIHLAAFSGVHEFDKNLLKSFNNNILATKNLVNFGFKKENTKLIFASSAAVYGKVSSNKINESHNCNPANYYGLSKLVCENIIKNAFKLKKNHYAILRYFNVVGSIHNFKIMKKINSLFDIVYFSIKKKKYKININGNSKDTRDGTPERDFIHIMDLCEIHNKTVNYLNKNKRIVVNCGSGIKYSVLEVVKAFEKKIKRKFKITYKVTNPDETQTICSNIRLAKNVLQANIANKKIDNLIKSYL